MKTLAERRMDCEKVSKKIEELGTQGLVQILKDAKQIHEGIGGTAVKLEIAGVQIFAKQIALSDLEMTNSQSTKNLFNLPTYYQYGVGSSGFGAWRELAIHQKTTNWALNGECESFPLMYGYAIIPRKISQPLDKKNLEERVKYWGNSPQIKNRIEAINSAKHSIVIFLENIAKTMESYIYPQIAKSEDAKEPNIKMVEEELKKVTNFLESKGIIHFDPHGRNILTDGDRLYFTDFGLATSLDFELSKEEKEFFEQNRSYDKSVALACLSWHPKSETGKILTIFPEVQATANRYQIMADRMGKFFDALREDETKQITYPKKEMLKIHQKICS